MREARRRGLPDPPRAVAEADRPEPQPEEPAEAPPANLVARPPGEPVVGEAPEPEPEPVAEEPDERTRLDATPAPEPRSHGEPAGPVGGPEAARSWLDEPEEPQRPTAPAGPSWIEPDAEITAERRPTAQAGSWLDEPPASAAAATDAALGRGWLDDQPAGGNGLTWAEEQPRPEPEDPDPPHGDPLVPSHREPGADDAPVAEPDDPDPPHGDPLSAIRGLDLPAAEPTGEIRRDLPPLPAPTASRQPPRAPRRPRRGGAPPPPSRPPGAPTTGRRRRRWRARVGAVAAIAGVVAAIVFLVELFQPFHGHGHGRVAITIPKGASAGDIGNLLADKGVVAHGSLFAIRASLAGKRGDFQAGGYTLQKDMPYGDAIDVLTGKPGAAATVNVTIPEGRGRRETAPLLAQAGVKGSYLAATRSSDELNPRAYGAPKSTPSLEGFLFPATYQLRREAATADRLVSLQLRSFKANLAKVNLSAARDKNLTRYDVIKIASMIDREAQVPRDRRLVAAVIYNRLKRDMPLGIDATTRYALNDWDKPLSNADFGRSGRYNTRRHTGLPPTPIGNPGLAALQAAAHPAHASYLYYVIKPCAHGAHAFSSTDARFQKDVARYNAARKRLGRSPVDC